MIHQKKNVNTGPRQPARLPSVSLIFGAPPPSAGVAGPSYPSSLIASDDDTGGLVASGEGTAAGCPNALGARKPAISGLSAKLTLGVGGAAVGLVADAGVPTAGGALELNSAQRGHLRFVSVRAFVRSFVRRCLSVSPWLDKGRRDHGTHSCGPSARSGRTASVKRQRRTPIRPSPTTEYTAALRQIVLTVVSGLTGRLSVMGVPPSFAILAFFRCRRRSWFFFIRAISSSSLEAPGAEDVNGQCHDAKCQMSARRSVIV